MFLKPGNRSYKTYRTSTTYMKNKNQPEKSLTKSLKYKAGRDSRGQISIRHRGGRHKRLYRLIDFKRDKRDIPAKIVSLEYDPNRGADIALLYYVDGEKRYILAPEKLEIGAAILAGEKAPIKPGNALPLAKIPIGTAVHNIELSPGRGGQLVRGAGNSATVLAREGSLIRLKLPSGEIRLIHKKCYATVGQLTNPGRKTKKLGKAGKKRHLGFRPAVRGVAQDPGSHPHGGGEGRSGIGMPSPKSPWGKKTLGKRTRKKKLSDKYIVKRRKS